MSAVGTLAAVLERKESGEGQHVETSLLGTALSVFNSHLIEEGGMHLGREPSGNRVQTSGPSDVFETADGHVLLHVVGNGLFRRIAETIGAPEWLNDARYASDQQRGDRRDELCNRVAAWCTSRTTDEVLDAMATAGVPAGPVLSIADALKHPQVEALNLLKTVTAPGREKEVPVADLPVKLSRTPGGIKKHPPGVSENSAEILAELGYSVSEIKALSDDGVI